MLCSADGNERKLDLRALDLRREAGLFQVTVVEIDALVRARLQRSEKAEPFAEGITAASSAGDIAESPGRRYRANV